MVEKAKNGLTEAEIHNLRRLYEDAFPVDERRPWDDILLRDADPASPLALRVYADGEALLTLWTFPDFRYVEHFAVAPSLRGKGLGGEILDTLVAEDPRPLVLEAEPAETSPMAARRLGFYRRHGLTPYEGLGYVQPPYGPGLNPVALELLTTSHSLDAPGVVYRLLHEVYGAESEKKNTTL